MALHTYGVLKAKVIGRRRATLRDGHYHLHLKAQIHHFRASINAASEQFPSELEAIIVPDLQHPVTSRVEQLATGFHPLSCEPGGAALDYIRGNLFQPWDLAPLPATKPGPDNDLNEKLDAAFALAVTDEGAYAYLFGEPFGPNPKGRDRYFQFSPEWGIHNIHMNQGNAPRFAGDNGVWQDGGVLIHYPGKQRWTGIFLKFQSQAWRTHDKTGAALQQRSEKELPSRQSYLPAGTKMSPVIITAALVNPSGKGPETEEVTLHNISSEPVNVHGWKLLDEQRRELPLTGTMDPGESRNFALQPPVSLPNRGGLISLLNHHHWRMHGVAYTKQQAQAEGMRIMFNDRFAS